MISTIIIIVLISFSLLIGNLVLMIIKEPQSCPKCGRFMIEKIVNGEKIIFCQECDYSEPKKKSKSTLKRSKFTNA